MIDYVCNNGLAVLIIAGSWDFLVIRMLLGLLSDELEGLNLLKPSGFFTYLQEFCMVLALR